MERKARLINILFDTSIFSDKIQTYLQTLFVISVKFFPTHEEQLNLSALKAVAAVFENTCIALSSLFDVVVAFFQENISRFLKYLNQSTLFAKKDYCVSCNKFHNNGFYCTNNTYFVWNDNVNLRIFSQL